MMKFSMRSIPAAATMTAALIFGAQAQAQTTTTPPTTAAGDKAAMPAGPNATPKTTEQRDATKPMAKPGMDAGAASTGGSANMPAGPGTTSKTMQQRDTAKPMAKSGAMAGSTTTGDAATMGEPVRQGDKVAKSKGERMDKSSKPKAKMTKSGEPTREAEISK